MATGLAHFTLKFKYAHYTNININELHKSLYNSQCHLEFFSFILFLQILQASHASDESLLC